MDNITVRKTNGCYSAVIEGNEGVQGSGRSMEEIINSIQAY